MKKAKNESKIDFGSYSDLFMVMAFVFLLLYVISTLNNGISLIQERHRSEVAKKELQEKVVQYEKKVDEALTDSQKEEYEALRVGLMRMQEEAREARKLAEEKEKTLEKYHDSVKTMAIIQAKANEELKEKTSQLEISAIEKNIQNRAIASLHSRIEEKNLELSKLNDEVNKRAQEITQIHSRVSELSSKAKLAKAQAKELESLKSDLSKKEKDLESVRENHAKLAESSQAQISELQEKYKKATAGLRKEIASSLASRLKAKGILADVDKSTGDVTVRFANAYFDYNSSSLKDEMKKELESFIPIYAQSLFENKKHASSISSIEIIGSASPSYNGQYINPRAIASEEEKKALNYNLDLSYRRAKKIFEHTFFAKDFKFAHREEMMPLVKVSGTGYLQALEDLKELPQPTQDKSRGFCGVYDCQTYQKVTLKFNLKDRPVQP